MDSDENFAHRDNLAFLNGSGSLRGKVVAAHAVVRRRFDFVARIALTLYDSETGVLKAYLHSGPQDDPLEHYQALLDNAPSLKEILSEFERVKVCISVIIVFIFYFFQPFNHGYTDWEG